MKRNQKRRRLSAENLEPRVLFHSSPVLQAEHDAVMNLVAYANVDVEAVSDGAWNDTSTWENGQIPVAGQDVLIPEGVDVVLAGETARIKTLRVDGTLSFSIDVDSRLVVDTVIVTETGHWNQGTDTNPVLAQSEVVFTAGAINTTYDPKLFSKGLISHGQTNIHGKDKLSWTNASSLVSAGNTFVELEETPVGWEVGDTILIPGVSLTAVQDELRTITNINGNIVEFAPLNFNHVVTDIVKLPIANMTRNVKFASESTVTAERGHVMIMHTNAVDVAMAEFENLGRTNKDVLINTTTNIRGRYSLHFHRNNQAEAIDVNGIVVNGSVGWGVVNHSANVNVHDSVSYNVFGAGFVTESGNELGSFDNNLAVRSTGSGDEPGTGGQNGTRQSATNADFGHAGHGFWMQGPLIEVTNNVAVGHGYSGFEYYLLPYKEKDTNAFALPNAQFMTVALNSDNVSIAAKNWGIRLLYGRDSAHNNEIHNFIGWNVGGGYSARLSEVKLHNPVFIGAGAGVGVNSAGAYGGGASVYNGRVENFQYGAIPANADTAFSSEYIGGTWNNTKDFQIFAGVHGQTVIDIEGATFVFVKPVIKSPFTATAQQFHFYEYVRPTYVVINGVSKRLYFKEQLPSFKPFTTGELAGLTNQQIADQYGFVAMGALVPAGAVNMNGYYRDA